MAKVKMTHPDEMMTVSVSLDFTAELNPELDDVPSLGTVSVECTLSTADAAVYLEDVIAAIRGRRLFGFMAQEAAISAVSAGEWIQGTSETTDTSKAADKKVNDQ